MYLMIEKHIRNCCAIRTERSIFVTSRSTSKRCYEVEQTDSILDYRQSRQRLMVVALSGKKIE